MVLLERVRSGQVDHQIRPEFANSIEPALEVPQVDFVFGVIGKADIQIALLLGREKVLLMDAECEDLEYEDNVLTFNFSIYDGYSSMIVYIILKVDENTMTGQWETGEGDTGAINMEKKE